MVPSLSLSAMGVSGSATASLWDRSLERLRGSSPRLDRNIIILRITVRHITWIIFIRHHKINLKESENEEDKRKAREPSEGSVDRTAGGRRHGVRRSWGEGEGAERERDGGKLYRLNLVQFHILIYVSI